MTTDLIVFGEDWGRHPSSTQHLIKRLAEDRKIIWVNSIGMRRPQLSVADFARVGKKVRSMFSAPADAPSIPVPKNMTIIEPRVIPLPGNSTAAKINRQILGRTLRKVMAEQSIVNPILWTSLPTAVEFLGICQEKAVVYYCGDEFGALAGVDHQPVLECERRLSEAADLILAASEPLANKFKSAKTKLVPHGVDFALFSEPALRAEDLPTGRPVAGFYGSLSEWLDQDLVVKCANLLPDWSFVFIGEERTDVSRIKNLPNAHLLGPRAHVDLPGYIQHWDVSIMPFVDNEQIRNCNPLKLREYLAAGRPVVATPFPALQAYDDILYVSDSADGMASALIDAKGEAASVRDMRRHIVEPESWTARAEDVRSFIEAY